MLRTVSLLAKYDKWYPYLRKMNYVIQTGINVKVDWVEGHMSSPSHLADTYPFGR